MKFPPCDILELLQHTEGEERGLYQVPFRALGWWMLQHSLGAGRGQHPLVSPQQLKPTGVLLHSGDLCQEPSQPKHAGKRGAGTTGLGD